MNTLLLALFLAAHPHALPRALPRATGTTPAAITVTDGGQVTLGGITYLVTVQHTITLTPVPAPVPPPPPPPPPPPLPGDPVINSYLGPGRAPLPANPVVAKGTVLFLEGSRFGTAIGQVQFAGNPVVVLSWSDSEIAITLPQQSTQGTTSTILVTRADGRSYSMSAAIIVQ